MRRTIRKTFLLEGETVTMKYVKQLCGEERYGRMIEDAKKKFFADANVQNVQVLLLREKLRRAANVAVFILCAAFQALVIRLHRAVKITVDPFQWHMHTNPFLPTQYSKR